MQVDGPVELGLGVDLTFVESGVAGFGGGDAKLPVVVGKIVVDAEPFLAGVAHRGVSEDMQVALPDPR